MNILITGGSSGLGKAIVDKLCQESNNKIYFTYNRNFEIANQLENTYSNSKGINVDLTSINELNNLVEMIKDLEIDGLVNNVYIGNPQGTYFFKTLEKDFQESFQLNVISWISITKACILGMKKRRFGRIVNILTSSLIDTPPLGYSVYTATKAYIQQLSKCIAHENIRYNITSNSVLPDFMNTNFGKVEEFQLESIIKNNPLKQILTPEEVAHVILLLIQSSSQLNGIEIPINAGKHLI